jgi:signal transduction histidine kinase
MKRTYSLGRGTNRLSPWKGALIGLVAIKVALSVSAASIPFALHYSGISYLLLLLLATGFSVRNGIQSTGRARPFWLLLAAGCGLWAFHQFLDVYYELWLGIEVPDNSIADEVLFLHLVPMMAAAACLPHLQAFQGRRHRWMLDTLLIFSLWAFLYGFLVSPYKYFLFSPSNYGARFDALYLIENLVLIATLGVVTLRARPPWKRTYLHLLGACALYSFSSTAANLAIDSGGYVNGKLYGIGLMTSVCWFVWIPLSARSAPETEDEIMRFAEKQDSQVSLWAMVSVAMISVPMIWELFQAHENSNIRTLRLIVATAAIVLLAGGAYLREYLDRRELALSFNQRLIQAQEEERARIARELHDDINQRVVVLALRLGQLKGSSNGPADDLMDQITALQEEIAQLSMSIQHMSQELHSSVLEFLGLTAAMRRWCMEFSEKRKIEILFESRDVPARLPSGASLHLYRVLQEALNNAAKYSGTGSFDVRLWGTANEIHLSVTDLGKGFDIATAMRGRGLGLKSMRERVKLIDGHLVIESKPNRGTRIYVRMPSDFGSEARREPNGD